MKSFFLLVTLALCSLAAYCQNWTDPNVRTEDLEKYADGNPQAELLIAARYRIGMNCTQSYEKAFQWYYRSASHGNAEAQYNMGEFYMNGIACTKDRNLALSWWRKGAGQGNAKAQVRLAVCLETDGQSGEAYDWMKRAADQNCYVAQYLMANFFYKDNPNQYFFWVSRAANATDDDLTGYGEISMISLSSIQLDLAKCYIAGRGIPRNLNKALYWAEKSVSNTNKIAGCDPGAYSFLYYVNNYFAKRPQDAFRWSLDGAMKGFPSAMLQAGWCYRNGIGTQKDENKSFQWIEKSANEGYVDAYNDLAYCYMRGTGCSVDRTKAWKLLNYAIQSNPNNPNFLDSKGDFFTIEGNIQKAQETWNEINQRFPSFYKDNETDFSKYIKSLNSDGIDINIPVNSFVNKNTFVVIIANENYQDVTKVPYALNDGNVFLEYCQKTLGIPTSNITFIKDATLNNMRRGLNWLKNILMAYNGQASVIFYYAGHGIPDETGTTTYLLPSDGIANDASTGYSLKDLYSTLNIQPARRILVFLDACFSGVNRDGKMLSSARGVAIKPKRVEPKGNLVVFSAAQEDETAWPYDDQKHGMFTYYLLKKIKDSKGNLTLGELSDYVCSEVKKQSILKNQKLQSPIVNASVTLGDNWRSWKIE